MMTLGACSTEPPILSPHYKNGRFENLDPAARSDKSFFDVLKWRMTEPRAEWPEFVDDNHKPDVATRVEGSELRLTMINHATVLVQTGGVNIITDPVFSDRVSPISFAGPKRHRAAGIKIEDLPPIDAVLISHSHYDHLDQASLQKIEEKFRPLYFVPLATAALLPKEAAARITEMDWGQSAAINDRYSVFFVPAQHWTARGLFDRNKYFWGGFVMRSQGSDGKTRQVYFAGDTGYNTHFKKIYEDYGTLDAALIPIGAYEPRWFMKMQHMNPQDAVQSYIDLGSPLSLGVHFGTFQLTDEAIDAPEKDLARALKDAGIDGKNFIAPKNGQTIILK